MLDEILLTLQDAITIIHKLFVNEQIRKALIQGMRNIFMAFKMSEAKYFFVQNLGFTVQCWLSTCWRFMTLSSSWSMNRRPFLDSSRPMEMATIDLYRTLSHQTKIMSSYFPLSPTSSLKFTTKMVCIKRITHPMLFKKNIRLLRRSSCLLKKQVSSYPTSNQISSPVDWANKMVWGTLSKEKSRHFMSLLSKITHSIRKNVHYRERKMIWIVYATVLNLLKETQFQSPKRSSINKNDKLSISMLKDQQTIEKMINLLFRKNP